MSTHPEPLPVELLVPADKRRLSVDQHHAFCESLPPPRPLDEIDELVEELRAAEPEGKCR